MDDARSREPARRWVETVVVELDLCPFAKREVARNRVRYSVCGATTEAQVLEDLRLELDLLDQEPSVETTLLILPFVLDDFRTYNDFLGAADQLLVDGGWEGVYQIASFHPDYQFADTEPDAAENFTNRSPDPMLHLLREESLAQAIAEHPDTAAIPEHNIALMRDLGAAELLRRLQACRDDVVRL